MFTIGIFTTHIPYIAFGVFYAFFILFGLNKASSGEIQLSERNIVFESPGDETLNKTEFGDPSDFYYHADAGPVPPGNLKMFVFNRKLLQKHTFFSDCWYSNVYPAFFSRPPPHFS